VRICYKCKQNKNLIEDFYKDRYDSLGRQKACKTCQKTRNTAYAETNRDYFRLKGKEKYNKADNKKRYAKYRTEYLKRRNKERSTEETRLYELFMTAKKRAKTKNLEFSIDFDWLWNQYGLQEGKCILTGISFTKERNKYGERFSFPFSVSIDRIDSSQGYTKQNTRLVCTIVNLALNRFGDEAFKQMCDGFFAMQNKS
jgi:hypothetical protein